MFYEMLDFLSIMGGLGYATEGRKQIKEHSERLDAFDSRLTAVETKASGFDSRLTAVETKVETIDTKVDSLNANMADGFNKLASLINKQNGNGGNKDRKSTRLNSSHL